MLKKFMALAAITLALPVHAAVVEVGDLNIINQVGNASDGLRYLDMSFSTGLSAVDAVANAQLTYANARLATASEFDDLFAAAGITYDVGASSASGGFLPGADDEHISTGANYDAGALMGQLGQTIPFFATAIWTDPDGSEDLTGTRDFLFLLGSRAQLSQTLTVPADAQLGWLVVSEVPVPAAAWLFGSALIGMAGVRRTKRSK